MSSHHRSGGPPSLMDDVRDFDHNFHSHRFEGARGGHRGRGMGGLRGRGGGGGEGGFGSRGGPRGGRGDFHQRDRSYNNHNFNHPDDDVRSSSSKMPSLFNVNHQPPPRSFDRDNNNASGRERMPYQRDSGRELSSGDDRYRHSGSRPSANDGLDFQSDKPGSQSNITGNPVPSLFAVQLDNPGIPPLISESNKPTDSYKDHHHVERSHGRPEHSSSHHDNDNHHRERDSRKNNAGGYDRSSSLNRDRSRSPRDRDRHGSSRDDRSFGMENRRGGRGGRIGGDQLARGNRGAHQHNPREPPQSRFGSDHHQSHWQDRRGDGRGQYHDRSRDMGSHHRPNEQLPSEHHHHPFSRESRPNFDAPTQNRPFQEGYPAGNFDPMGPSGQNRSNYNQGPPSNRPDYYGSNNNNPGFSQHGSRSGGRPSRFSDRQDEYDDERPLTKPNLPLPNIPTTTPLYMNQPNNPTFSQPRPSLSTTFSSQQQQPPGLFPTIGPSNHNQPPPSQFPWSNQQLPGSTSSHMTQPLTSMGSKDQSNPSLLGTGPMPNFYGGNNEFHRQQTTMATNPYYAGVPPVSAQTASKPSTVNPPSMGLLQTPLPTSTASSTTAASNASNVEAWQQYYQQCWQFMQQQQAGTQLSGSNPLPTQQPFPQRQSNTATPSAASSKAPATTSAGVQDPNATQANIEAWAQYWIQYQAYAQQQAQMPTVAAAVPGTTTTITAPSQLYSQAGGKQTNSASALPSTGISLMSNPQSWLNPKG